MLKVVEIRIKLLEINLQHASEVLKMSFSIPYPNNYKHFSIIYAEMYLSY